MRIPRDGHGQGGFGIGSIVHDLGLRSGVRWEGELAGGRSISGYCV